METIAYKTLKLIKNLLFCLAIISQLAISEEIFKITNPYGREVILDLALTRSQQTKGLSGLKSNKFSSSRGMLFINSEIGPRRFWMLDTFFNLDIIFLDNNLKIVGIEKNVPSHPGPSEPPLIYKTETYLAQYVLETKAHASFGIKLKKNDQLKFSGPISLSEIGSSIRLKQ
jgi:uncharacterized membrane protein (UPF0127 family)